MESINCANCGAPLQTHRDTQCSYCRSIFDTAMNKIDDMVFRSGYGPSSSVAYSTAALLTYSTYPMPVTRANRLRIDRKM